MLNIAELSHVLEEQSCAHVPAPRHQRDNRGHADRPGRRQWRRPDDARRGSLVQGGHILITKGIGTFTYQVVHVNAEFANQVSDHDPQVVDIKP